MRLTRAQLLKGAAALVVLRKLPALPEAAPTVADGIVWPAAVPPVQLWAPKLGWRMIQPIDADCELWQLTWQNRDGMIMRSSYGVTQTLAHAQTNPPFSIAQEEKFRLEREVYSQGGRMTGTARGEAKDWWPHALA